MAIDFNKIRERLENLENPKKASGNNADKFWKPTLGTTKVRMTPPTDGDPFRDYHFHYKVGKAFPFLCPRRNFGEECPVCNFAYTLWNGSADEKEVAKKLFPTQRFYTKIVVRGEETNGIKLWGHPKTIYEKLMKKINNPDYGDISDMDEGNDITVEMSQNPKKPFPDLDAEVSPKKTSFCGDLSKEDCKKILKEEPSWDLITENAIKTKEEIKAILNDAFLKESDAENGEDGVEKYGDKEEKPEDVDTAFTELLKDDE